MKNCCQQQDKSYRNAQSCCTMPICQKWRYGQITSYRNKLIARRTNRITLHRLRASRSNAPLCRNLLSVQIRSYCKTPISNSTNRIVMPRAVVSYVAVYTNQFVFAQRRAMCLTALLCHHWILLEQLFQFCARKQIWRESLGIKSTIETAVPLISDDDTAAQ